MKKAISLGIIIVFVFSLVPFVFAQEAGADASIKTDVHTRIGVGLSKDRFQRLSNLSNERLQKIAELDKRQIGRLSELDIKNLNKISQLKKERLERISNLSQEKLERLSQLEQEKLEKISDLNEDDTNKLLALGRARLKEIANLDNTGLMAALKTLKIVKVKNAEDLEVKQLSEAKLEQLRVKFEKAKEGFKKSKDELEDAKNKLKEARQKGDENSTLTNAKDYLLKVTDVLTNHLEKIKTQVQENKNIPDEREKAIVTEIDVQISEIAGIKADIQSATTKEQIKEDAKKLFEKWNKLKQTIKLHAENVVSARVEGLVNMGLVLEKKLDNVLAKAKENGIEINVSSQINSFSEKVADSRDKYKQAQAKITEAFDLRAKGEPADSDKIKALIQESDNLLKEARDAIKEAHDILKTIVKSIKESDPKADISAETEVEVTQETSVNK